MLTITCGRMTAFYRQDQYLKIDKIVEKFSVFPRIWQHQPQQNKGNRSLTSRHPKLGDTVFRQAITHFFRKLIPRLGLPQKTYVHSCG